MTTVNHIPSVPISYGDPTLIREGVFEATFVHKSEESLFLRMELITEENSKSWGQFKASNVQMANLNSRGILSVLVQTAGKDNYPSDADIQKYTGFTKQEAAAFKEKAIKLKETDNKITDVINNNCVGANHMMTGYSPGESNYILYITKNRSFSIQNTKIELAELTLKQYIEAYGDILISVGSDFTNSNYFHNRGISRNPYWVFERKYSGLSMLLHGFAAKVAKSYFPDKEFMKVIPVGSMQSIITKSLLPGDGYLEHHGKKIDLTKLTTRPENGELGDNWINIPALIRIYDQTINCFNNWI